MHRWTGQLLCLKVPRISDPSAHLLPQFNLSRKALSACSTSLQLSRRAEIELLAKQLCDEG